MPKQLNDIQQKELHHIKDWCLTILNFMIEKSGDNPLFQQFKNIIVETHEKQNLKGLRHVIKDVNEWAKGLSKSDFDELNNLLNRKFEKDLIKEDTKISNKISQVLKKGKISNEEEYRMLLNRVEEIYADESKKEEVKSFNKLLADYHK